MHSDTPRPPAELTPHPPVVKTCGWCSHWVVPDPNSSADPRGDARMGALGLRPCAKSGQGWRYFDIEHRCHLPQETAR